jgi:DNA-binding LacI/PurR family transcriptional regulator
MVVTIKDIAEKVGKSITTVSRALHDYDDVSAETKALVRQAADELGYTPNKQAFSLVKRRANALGLILPTFGPRFSDPFYSEFIAGVSTMAARHEFDLVVSAFPPGEQELKAYRQDVQSRRVDGFIVLRVRTEDDRIAYLQQVDFPFVTFGRTLGAPTFPFVDEDGAAGMRQVADHLARLGHRRIGVIIAPANLTFTRLRLAGLEAGLAKHVLRLIPELTLEGDLTEGSGAHLAQKLMDQAAPPTAIVAWNDLMAFGAMSAIQQRGQVVGQDISVTGFDDLPMAEHSHPPLTTVKQPIYAIGGQVCEMLIRLLVGDTLNQPQVLLNPELVIRASTGQAPHQNKS